MALIFRRDGLFVNNIISLCKWKNYQLKSFTDKLMKIKMVCVKKKQRTVDDFDLTFKDSEKAAAY